MAQIGIVGYGYVGKAVEYGFKAKNKIIIHDKYLPSASLDDVVGRSEFIFICVPTPMTRRYTKIDLSIVKDVFYRIVKLSRQKQVTPVIVIKSTVVPGTTRDLSRRFSWPKTLFNPEFLTEKNYLEDFVKADRIIIGGDVPDVTKSLAGLYHDSFPHTPLYQTDPTTAEMSKYMANTFLATKVIFANEMWQMCEKLGIGYEEVKRLVVADRRIFDSHLDVTVQRGFGKKCFPKDTVALLGLARSLDVDLSVLKAVWKKNLQIRQARDWEDIPGAVSGKK